MISPEMTVDVGRCRPDMPAAVRLMVELNYLKQLRSSAKKPVQVEDGSANIAWLGNTQSAK